MNPHSEPILPYSAILRNDEKMKANDDFICALCGAEDMPGVAGSTLTLAAGYGSIHDMGRVTVPLCGGCCDKLFSELSKLRGATVESLL